VSRAARLLELLQVLRCHRQPVSGARLASGLGVSLRTLYRDIASLQAQGATIDGAAGLGYVMRPGFVLPPLMFKPDELEALALGAVWAAQQGDPGLGLGARNALAKISAVLPHELREEFEHPSMLVGPRRPGPSVRVDMGLVRRAIRGERKVRISYRDKDGRASRRTVWPFAMGFFQEVRVVIAWCESREGFRHFRADRIVSAEETGERYPRRRRSLLRQWRESENIPQP